MAADQLLPEAFVCAFFMLCVCDCVSVLKKKCITTIYTLVWKACGCVCVGERWGRGLKEWMTRASVCAPMVLPSHALTAEKSVHASCCCRQRRDELKCVSLWRGGGGVSLEWWGSVLGQWCWRMPAFICLNNEGTSGLNLLDTQCVTHTRASEGKSTLPFSGGKGSAEMQCVLAEAAEPQTLVCFTRQQESSFHFINVFSRFADQSCSDPL